MDSTNGKPPKPSRIGMIGKAEAEYMAVCVESVECGLEVAVVDSMVQMHARLTKDPRDFSEPLFRLSKLRMMVRRAAITPLRIEYGIHEVEQVVVIRKLRWLVRPGTLPG